MNKVNANVIIIDEEIIIKYLNHLLKLIYLSFFLLQKSIPTNERANGYKNILAFNFESIFVLNFCLSIDKIYSKQSATHVQ